MSLTAYFAHLIKQVEQSDQIDNAGKDKNGFYKPTRNILLKNLNLLKDLHANPRAKAMVKAAWTQVVADLPSEWLVLTETQKAELKKILE
ncbi:MAG: hypothetical protein AB7N80_02795 [Bdellovibrionales bacterium]